MVVPWFMYNQIYAPYTAYVIQHMLQEAYASQASNVANPAVSSEVSGADAG